MNKFIKRLEKSRGVVSVTQISGLNPGLIISLSTGEKLLLKEAEKIDKEREGQVFEMFSLSKDNGQRFFKTFKQIEVWTKARARRDPTAILYS